MSEALQIRDDGDCVRIAGRIDVDNAGDALARGRKALAGGTCRVDLSQLESADSVTLAVLIAWAAPASMRGTPIEFSGVAPRLQALAQLSDADGLIGMPVATESHVA